MWIGLSRNCNVIHYQRTNSKFNTLSSKSNSSLKLKNTFKFRHIVRSEEALSSFFFYKKEKYLNDTFIVLLEKVKSSVNNSLLTLSWRRPLSYRNSANQLTGFYMTTASVMKELRIKFLTHSPWTQDVNWTYIRRQDDLWTSYVR